MVGRVAPLELLLFGSAAARWVRLVFAGPWLAWPRRGCPVDGRVGGYLSLGCVGAAGRGGRVSVLGGALLGSDWAWTLTMAGVVLAVLGPKTRRPAVGRAAAAQPGPKETGGPVGAAARSVGLKACGPVG